MPIPMVLPTMTARPKPTPRRRMRPDGGVVGNKLCEFCELCGFCVTVASDYLVRFEGDQHDVDSRAEVPCRVARADLFELHIAALPAVDGGTAVRRLFDLAAGPLNRDGVGAVSAATLLR